MKWSGQDEIKACKTNDKWIRQSESTLGKVKVHVIKRISKEDKVKPDEINWK